jgi:hypothetical protein
MMALLTNSGNGPPVVERHALLLLGGEINHEAVLLVISVDLVRRILCQVVE